MFPRRARVLRTLHTSFQRLQIGVPSRGLNFHRSQLRTWWITFGQFKHGHVQNIEVATSENGDVIHIKGECLPEMKKNLKYKLNVTMINSGEQAGEITYACCSPCPAGKGPFASCKHLAALCFALEEFVRLKKSRDFATCTDRLQTWNQPRKRKLEPRSVYEIDFSKKRSMVWGCSSFDQ